MKKKIKEIDYIDLEKRGDRNKFYSWVPGLYLSKNIKDRDIKFDDKLYICSKKGHKTYRGIIEKYTKDNFNLVNLSSIILFYKYSKDEKYYYAGEERVRRFLSAVKIFYNKNSDSLLGLSVCDDKKDGYFKIDNYSTNSYRHRDIITEVHWRRKFIEIKDEDELKQIKIIYKNLGIIDIENFYKYSPLHNSVKFFEHAYNKDWILLKIMLLFISLESILGEKTETTYKISSRASYLLYPNEPNKRIEVFNFLKKAYAVRSNFAHGGDVEKELLKIDRKMQDDNNVEDYDFVKELQKIVVGCLRVILLDEELTKLFSSKNKDKISIYLDNLVIG